MNRVFTGKVSRIKKTISQQQVVQWKELTFDFNQIYEKRNSKHEPLIPGIVCEALISEAISKEMSGHSYVILEKELIFLHPVSVGNTITVELETTNVNTERDWITEKIRCLNEAGKEVIRGRVIVKTKKHN
ncbi:MaoC/PaaZ C-terminal domain-containing protein [Desertibacillus haloalkaliphilus]|uniref:MaoC/PaaZ C-terminal domain-containing protein n=1 Tax=Desertibacillus haloalkaliphilus TaxID=1328930 RepID=UPI001C256A93|nr:MaoC/PaaZ C-terminal domain-containing protein [Desertibacillus haloalkaliphilus]MBU8906065.1 hypothetical protein [Desertibacillus haloalkaliphilus]